VEQELVDAYVRNELSRDRRQRFEKNYLTTDTRKARVLTAQSFLHVVCPARPQKVTFVEKLQAFWQRPLVPQSAIAILVLVIGVALLLPLLRGGRSPQTYQRVDLAISRTERATGGATEKVTLPLGKDALEIHLKLPEQSPNTTGYRVQWENVTTALGDLKIKSQDAQSIVVVIPAAELTPGQYILKLFEIKSDGTEQRVNGAYNLTAEEAPRTR